MSKLFFKNKYTLCYYRIIERAQQRIELEGYVEKHHIVPKSIGDKNSPVVKLTAKEHYICHLLLYKMVISPKHKRSMAYAIWGFKGKNKWHGERFTGAMYLKLRENWSKLNCGKDNPFYGKGHLVSGEKNHFYGKHHTKEALDKMSISSLEKCKGEKNGFYGRHHKQKTKKLLSEQRKGFIHSCGPYEFTSPSGKKYLVSEGLKAFCETHKLVQPNVIEAANTGKKTKGWVVKHVKTDENKIDQKDRRSIPRKRFRDTKRTSLSS